LLTLQEKSDLFLFIGACDEKGVVLRPVKGFMKNIEWTVKFPDGSSGGDASYLQQLKDAYKDKLIVRLTGK